VGLRRLPGVVGRVGRSVSRRVLGCWLSRSAEQVCEATGSAKTARCCRPSGPVCQPLDAGVLIEWVRRAGLRSEQVRNDTAGCCRPSRLGCPLPVARCPLPVARCRVPGCWLSRTGGWVYEASVFAWAAGRLGSCGQTQVGQWLPGVGRRLGRSARVRLVRGFAQGQGRRHVGGACLARGIGLGAYVCEVGWLGGAACDGLWGAAASGFR
jgi:hypothetical protein